MKGILAAAEFATAKNIERELAACRERIEGLMLWGTPAEIAAARERYRHLIREYCNSR
jgi:hypothetical protein